MMVLFYQRGDELSDSPNYSSRVRQTDKAPFSGALGIGTGESELGRSEYSDSEGHVGDRRFGQAAGVAPTSAAENLAPAQDVLTPTPLSTPTARDAGTGKEGGKVAPKRVAPAMSVVRIHRADTARLNPEP